MLAQNRMAGEPRGAQHEHNLECRNDQEQRKAEIRRVIADEEHAAQHVPDYSLDERYAHDRPDDGARDDREVRIGQEAQRNLALAQAQRLLRADLGYLLVHDAADRGIADEQANDDEQRRHGEAQPVGNAAERIDLGRARVLVTGRDSPVVFLHLVELVLVVGDFNLGVGDVFARLGNIGFGVGDLLLAIGHFLLAVRDLALPLRHLVVELFLRLGIFRPAGIDGLVELGQLRVGVIVARLQLVNRRGLAVRDDAQVAVVGKRRRKAAHHGGEVLSRHIGQARHRGTRLRDDRVSAFHERRHSFCELCGIVGVLLSRLRGFGQQGVRFGRHALERALR